MPTKKQLQARLNPTPFKVKIPTDGLFRAKGDYGSTIYRRTPQGLETFDVTELGKQAMLRDNPGKDRLGNPIAFQGQNAGSFAARGVQELKKRYGFDINQLPEVLIPDLYQQMAKEGLGYNNPSGAYVAPVQSISDITRFLKVPKASLTEKMLNTQRPPEVTPALEAAARGERIPQETLYATDQEINQVGEGGIVTRNGQQYRINPAGELIPVQNTTQSFLTLEQQANINRARQSLNTLNALKEKGLGSLDVSTLDKGTNLQDLLQQVEDFAVNNVITPIVESGKTVNPQAVENLPDINIEDFFKQAEKELSPYYKQKFNIAKQDLVRGLQEIGVDLGKELAGITRESEKATLTGRESLAGRGLTFSGQRNKFESDITGATNRATEQARTLTFRSAGDIGRQTERLIGTERLKGLELPQIGGEQAYTPSTEPLIGTLQQERRSAIQELGRARAEDAAKRRALTFA